MPSNLTPFLFLGLMVLMFIWMSRSSKKARERMAEQRDSIIKVGANVMTQAGFYGTIVDVDGDAITLQSPSGDETVWDRKAIAGLAEIPLAAAAEEEEREEDEGVPAEQEAASDGQTAFGGKPASDDDETDKPKSPFSSK